MESYEGISKGSGVYEPLRDEISFYFTQRIGWKLERDLTYKNVRQRQFDIIE